MKGPISLFALFVFTAALCCPQGQAYGQGTLVVGLDPAATPAIGTVYGGEDVTLAVFKLMAGNDDVRVSRMKFTFIGAGANAISSLVLSNDSNALLLGTSQPVLYSCTFSLPPGNLDIPANSFETVSIIAHLGYVDGINFVPGTVIVAGIDTASDVSAIDLATAQPIVTQFLSNTPPVGYPQTLGYYTPPLSFVSTPGALQLVWPSNYTNFSLQSVPNLSSTNAWQTVAGPYPLSNNSFNVSIPIKADSQQFFRLTAPGQ